MTMPIETAREKIKNWKKKFHCLKGYCVVHKESFEELFEFGLGQPRQAEKEDDFVEALIEAAAAVEREKCVKIVQKFREQDWRRNRVEEKITINLHCYLKYIEEKLQQGEQPNS